MFGSKKDNQKNKADKVVIEPAKPAAGSVTKEKTNDKPVSQSQQVSATAPSVSSTQQHQSTASNQPVQVDRSNPMETLISESCKVEGNIYSEKSIKVDGKVEGSINVKETLIISAQGQVVGDITAESLIVYGNLKGDSQLKEIHIQDGGHIDGNIKTQSLKVDPNATYNGVVTMTKESLQPASALIHKKNNSDDKAASESSSDKA